MKLYRHQQKIVQNVKLNLPVTFVQFVIFLMMNMSKNKFFIVKGVEYVELGVEIIFFTVIIARVACQIFRGIITHVLKTN